MRLECLRRCVGMIRRGAAWSPGLPGVVAETTPKYVVSKERAIANFLLRVFEQKGARTLTDFGYVRVLSQIYLYMHIAF